MDLEGWDAVEKFPLAVEKDSKAIIGATIAYKFDGRDSGWARELSKVLRVRGLMRVCTELSLYVSS